MLINRMLMTLTVVATILISTDAAAGGEARSPVASAGSTSSAIDGVIEERMKEVGMAGLAAAVIVNKKVVWTKAYGFADKQSAVPFTTDTIMGVASIAKPFVGVAMMRAVHEGKLSLDEDINKYLPFRVVNPHYPNAVITLRQLATHSSSITDRWEVYSGTYYYGGDAPEPLGHFLEQYFARDGKNYSQDNFLDAKPGELREYCNIGAALAGYIVERAFGEQLNVYTRKHIFTPLKMTRTGWFLSEVDLANHAKPYVSHNGLIIPIPLYSNTTYPEGGVRTSVTDLSKFFIAMLNGGQYQGARILDADSTAEMLRFQFTDANRPRNFPAEDGNSGLFWRTKFNGALVGHGGNDPGIQAEMLWDRSREVGVIMFSNTSFGESDQGASSAIFDALLKHAASLKDEEKRTSGR